MAVPANAHLACVGCSRELHSRKDALILEKPAVSHVYAVQDVALLRGARAAGRTQG